jgi:hypothetical protein
VLEVAGQFGQLSSTHLESLDGVWVSDGQVQCMGCVGNDGPRLGSRRTPGRGFSGRSQARAGFNRRARRAGLQARPGRSALAQGPHAGAVASIHALE